MTFIEDLSISLAVQACTLALFALLAATWTTRHHWRTAWSLWRLRRNGVTSVYVDRSDLLSKDATTVDEYIISACHTFTYVGVYFSAATDQARVDNSIRSLIKSGRSVCITLFHPEGPEEIISYMEEYFALAHNTLKGRISHALNHFVALRDTLGSSERHLLDIRTHTFPLAQSAFLIDDGLASGRLLVDTKWFGSGKSKSFGLNFKGVARDGTLYATLRDSMRRVVAASVGV